MENTSISHYDSTGQALLVSLLEEESNSILRQLRSSDELDNTTLAEKILTREDKLTEIYTLFQMAHEELRLSLTILDSISDIKYGPIKSIGPFMGEDMHFVNIQHPIEKNNEKKLFVSVEERMLEEALRLGKGIEADYLFLKTKVLPSYRKGFTRIQREISKKHLLPEYMVDCGISQLVVPLLPFEGLEEAMSLDADADDTSSIISSTFLFISINGYNILDLYGEEYSHSPIFIAHLSKLSEHLFKRIISGLKEHKKCPFEMINPFHIRFNNSKIIKLSSLLDDNHDDNNGIIPSSSTGRLDLQPKSTFTLGKQLLQTLISSFLRKENNLFISLLPKINNQS